ncbi:hypothetical protein ABBQ38_005863 [Trebouxia sp. C0009 RCD-2024]
MAHAMKLALLVLVCAALVAQPVAAQRGYNFGFGGGYGSGIFNSAKYYQQNGISQGQYRQDLSGALRRSGASASAAASGFADAMASALVGGDYGTYGYSCAGAIGFGSTGSWTNAFANARSHGFNSGGAAAAAAATSGGRFGGDVASATAAAASSVFGNSASAAAAAASSGRKLLASG